MKTYLSNILPRIQQYNQSLDKKELLIDQPWVLIDEAGNKQQYIFERDGRLIMSHNGQVQYGQWKYIPAAKSLLIDRANDSLLLNQAFFNEALCVLKKDGFQNDPWVLINEKLIPDLDVSTYLQNLSYGRPVTPKVTFQQTILDEDPDVVRRSNLAIAISLIFLVLIITLMILLEKR